MSTASQHAAREAAISLFADGTPTLGAVMKGLIEYDRGRDNAWRNMVEETFCEGVPEARTCREKYAAWHKEHPDTEPYEVYPDGCPKPCDTCKSIRGMSP